MSHNLVPEVRPDRNGKLVTRHVKNEIAAGNRTPLPSPAKASRSKAAERLKVKQQVQSAMDELVENGVPLRNAGSQAQHNIHYLLTKDSSLVEAIVEVAKRATQTEKDVWSHELSFDYRIPVDWQDDTDYTKDYRMSLNLNSLGSLIADQQPLTTSPVYFSRSLVYSTKKMAEKFQREEDFDWMRSAMLVSETASKSLGVGRGELNMERYQSDIEFISDNWSRVVPLIPELVKRNNATRGLIETIWSNMSPSLSQGLL